MSRGPCRLKRRVFERTASTTTTCGAGEGKDEDCKVHPFSQGWETSADFGRGTRSFVIQYI